MSLRKEERRQRRKAMKRLVEAGVVGDGEEFEGFQGSGELALLKRPSGAGGGTAATSSSGSNSRSHSRSQSHSQSQESREGFGHFVSAPPAAEEDDEDADLDGGLYARKKSKSGTHSNEVTPDWRRNPSSLSRTSASVSDRAHHHQPIPNPGGPKSKHSQSRSRSNTSSQSPSLPSPSSPAFSDTLTQAGIVSPSTVEQGQGFFDLEEEPPVREGGRIGGGEFPVGRIGGGSFPMTGFAGTGNGGGGGGKRSRDFGAFLARRGDEEEEGRVGDVDGV